MKSCILFALLLIGSNSLANSTPVFEKIFSSVGKDLEAELSANGQFLLTRVRHRISSIYYKTDDLKVEDINTGKVIMAHDETYGILSSRGNFLVMNKDGVCTVYETKTWSIVYKYGMAYKESGWEQYCIISVNKFSQDEKHLLLHYYSPSRPNLGRPDGTLLVRTDDWSAKEVSDSYTFNSNSKFIAEATRDCKNSEYCLKIYIRTWATVAELPVKDLDYVGRASPDGKFLAVFRVKNFTTGDPEMQLYETENWKRVHQYSFEIPWHVSSPFSSNSRYILGKSGLRYVVVDTADGSQHSIASDTGVPIFSENSDFLLVPFAKGDSKLLSTRDWNTVSTIPTSGFHSYYPVVVNYSADGKSILFQGFRDDSNTVYKKAEVFRIR